MSQISKVRPRSAARINHIYESHRWYWFQMYEVVMQISLGMASLSNNKAGYQSRLVAAEEPSILNMQVPWDEQ